MPQLTLIRYQETYGSTFGILMEGETLVCHTVERLWFDNKVNVSCIPEGDYNVVVWGSPKFGKCFFIQDVVNRTFILFHPANFAHELKGCIGPGLKRGNIKGEDAVLSSKKCMSKLLKKYPNGFRLKITGLK